jgi:hypothetical protein
VPDGRYLARDPGEGGAKRVLVVETLGAPPPPGRRRRQPQPVQSAGEPASLPLTRATAVLAYRPFGAADEAMRWLEGITGEEGAVDALVAEGADLLNRALHASAVASADPRPGEVDAGRSVTVRIGYGTGEEVADGRFAVAREVDVRASGRTRRQRREEDLRPQERLAAVLGGRERIDACETLLLRARADLDSGRTREAALQLRVGAEALLVELAGALADPGHGEDTAQLEARHDEIAAAAQMALRGDLDPDAGRNVGELLEICERVLRRRRVLRG